MPRGSKELTSARKEEIVDACAQLYETTPFSGITLGEIGARTSFTRTSVYNYFRTKEEIFLALLEREYSAWVTDLNALADAPVGADGFSGAFSSLLEKRKCMLRLLSMNLYDLESGSRIENLASFKRVYNLSLKAVARCLKAHYPAVTDDDAEGFIYAFYPFLFGVYPYTSATEKQIKAMEIAGVERREYTIAEIVCALVEKLTQSFR